MNTTANPRKFLLGQMVATPAAYAAIEDSGQDPAFFLECHARGDWGDLDAHDRHANDEALLSGERILSAYSTLKGERLYVITEGVNEDGRRYKTTILLPEEY